MLGVEVGSYSQKSGEKAAQGVFISLDECVKVTQERGRVMEGDLINEGFRS